MSSRPAAGYETAVLCSINLLPDQIWMDDDVKETAEMFDRM